MKKSVKAMNYALTSSEMKKVHIFSTLIQITFMDEQWFKNYQHHGFLSKEAEDFAPEKVDELVKKKRGYLLEFDKKYPKELHENHNELPFLAERMKIGKVEKLVPNR